MKKFVIVGFVIAALGAGWLGRPAYRAYKEKKFAAQATEALTKDQPRKALLAAQQVLAINSNNLAACRVMADLADLSRSPHAMVWRRRISEVEPTLSNRVVFAACALRYEQPPFPIASQMLQEMGSGTSNDVAFHLVSAQLALKQNRIADGEKHLEEAIRLEPTNALHQINLSVVRLESRDAAVSAVAHAQLEQSQSHPLWGAQALRSLAAHHLGRKQFADAERFSTALLRGTNSTFGDRLEHLAILRGGDSPQFAGFVAALQREAATNVFAATDLVTRLTALGAASDAIAWAKSLAPAIRNEPPLPMAVASSYFSAGRWRELEESLNAQNWKERDFIRQALLSYAVRKQNSAEVADAHWRDAVRLASERPELLGTLAQMAGAWNWTNETETILWRAAKEFPRERWPLDSLQSGYTRMRNTRGLYELNAFVLDRQPTNSFAQNNWATLSLLLQTNLPKAHQIARQVYDRDTNNFVFVSTYAFSLHVQGRSAEGLKLIETLKPARLDDPSVASYYGVLLAASGEKEKAQRYFEKAEKAPILPEEMALISEARKKL
ncbi:MAG TPA: hypothetical protein VGF13_10615 [Verrucomicrobiae bacterium]|jgi:tetratricopeptide (TPR) repeat protein